MASELGTIGCGGIAIAALTLALEAVRRNRRLVKRLDDDEGR